jgi:hypothetical protein
MLAKPIEIRRFDGVTCKCTTKVAQVIGHDEQNVKAFRSMNRSRQTNE